MTNWKAGEMKFSLFARHNLKSSCWEISGGGKMFETHSEMLCAKIRCESLSSKSI